MTDDSERTAMTRFEELIDSWQSRAGQAPDSAWGEGYAAGISLCATQLRRMSESSVAIRMNGKVVELRVGQWTVGVFAGRVK